MARSTKILLFFLALWTVVGIIGLKGFMNSTLPSSNPASFTNRPAPDFQIDFFSGKNARLSNFKGKTPVVINLWASWCPPCREEASTLAKVASSYEGKVKFIGVVTNDSREKAEAFIDEFDITYDNGIDMGGAIAAKYKITGIPETFFIDIDGNITDHWIGAIDEQSLLDRINKIL